jgi:5-methyltetrahydrofolate--homocysteine methyltransferase
MNYEKNTFRKALNNSVLVSDGAMGTMLQQKGLAAGECAEEWNITRADIVRAIHSDYFNAGADIVETNTFGGNRARLSLHGLSDKVTELNREAVNLAQSVCPPHKFVAGTATYESLFDIFSEQVSALISAGADLIIIETMTDVTEVRAAANAVREIDSDIPLILSMTFEKSQGGFHTMMGTTPAQAVQELDQLKPDVIGSNCGEGAPEMIELMRVFRTLTSLPLLAQANAGNPELRGNEYFYNETPAERGEYAEHLLSLGVKIIGGCCGTTPEHIRAIRTAVDKK